MNRVVNNKNQNEKNGVPVDYNIAAYKYCFIFY